jgi:hypothetical protein
MLRLIARTGFKTFNLSTLGKVENFSNYVSGKIYLIEISNSVISNK